LSAFAFCLAFFNLFFEVLQNYQVKKTTPVPKKPVKDFIVYDEDSEEESNQSLSTSDNDEQLFYIRTTRKLSEKSTKAARTRKADVETSSTSNERSAYTTARTTILRSSSSSSSASDSSSLSDEYDTPVKSRQNIKRKNSESALETIFKTPAVNKGKNF
jgi:hypothetical protein